MHTENSPKLLHVQYDDKQALYNAYMSFCRDGGLFVPGSMTAHLGTSLHLMVQLPGEPDMHMVSGKVVWINMNKKKGLGIRMIPDEFSRKLQTAIQNSLGGMIKSPNPTFTM
jgi:type IV pilus assembly protein PilZ